MQLSRTPNANWSRRNIFTGLCGAALAGCYPKGARDAKAVRQPEQSGDEVRGPVLNGGSYYVVTNTLATLEQIGRLELTSPPLLNFSNRPTIADAFERQSVSPVTLESEWTPKRNETPAPHITSKDTAFAPDFFMLGNEFFSKSLRDLVSRVDEQLHYADVIDEDSASAFVAQDYKMPLFPSLSPFEKPFGEYALELMDKRPLTQFAPAKWPTLNIRSGFHPSAPIFNVAEGPWLMCTEEFMQTLMPHKISGLCFYNCRTWEEFLPGA